MAVWRQRFWVVFFVFFCVYSLDGHPGHRLQGSVARRREVVSVAVHLDGFQPVAHRAEGGKVRRALV